jgi:hypothetical protein
MDGGFDITFREVVPESGIVELVVGELDKMAPRFGLHCSVVVRRGSGDPGPFCVHVELRGRKAAPLLTADAVDADQQLALRVAFTALRAEYAAHVGLTAPYGERKVQGILYCVR